MRISMVVFTVLLFLFLAGCADQPTIAPDPVIMPSTTTPPATEPEDATPEVEMFVLTSSAFSDGGFIADKYTYKLGRQCSGENYSPPLEWKGTPEGTQSLLLTVIDPDGGNWIHWIIANIPVDITSLDEVVNGAQVGIAGTNDFGTIGYGGPCPPSGTHRYVFTLYALDTMLDIQTGATYKTVAPLFKDHVLGQATLTGLKQAK